MTTEHNPGGVDTPPEHTIKRDIETIERDEARLAHDVERLEHDLSEQRRHVDITVNRKHVRLDTTRVTGLQIKQAAIQQGVHIDENFQLWEEFPDGTERQIGDHDHVTVHEGSSFSAIAPDDNS
jgi:hypothetical protein